MEKRERQLLQQFGTVKKSKKIWNGDRRQDLELIEVCDIEAHHAIDLLVGKYRREFFEALDSIGAIVMRTTGKSRIPRKRLPVGVDRSELGGWVSHYSFEIPHKDKSRDLHLQALHERKISESTRKEALTRLSEDEATMRAAINNLHILREALRNTPAWQMEKNLPNEFDFYQELIKKRQAIPLIDRIKIVAESEPPKPSEDMLYYFAEGEDHKGIEDFFEALNLILGGLKDQEAHPLVYRFLDAVYLELKKKKQLLEFDWNERTHSEEEVWLCWRGDRMVHATGKKTKGGKRSKKTRIHILEKGLRVG